MAVEEAVDVVVAVEGVGDGDGKKKEQGPHPYELFQAIKGGVNHKKQRVAGKKEF